MKTIPLSNSVKILFDVFQITNQDKCKTSVLNALKMIIIFQKVKMIFFITKHYRVLEIITISYLPKLF